MPHASAPSLIRVEQRGAVYLEAKFRVNGRQVKRRIGPAWEERGPSGLWRPRSGRLPDGYFDERRAHAAAAQLVADHLAEAADTERAARERVARRVTFREVAYGYLRWLADVKAAKPSTIKGHGYLLAEPGRPHKRGKRRSAGHIMAAIGDTPAIEVTARDVEGILESTRRTGVTGRTVNEYRALVSAVYGYGMKASTFGLPSNPATHADKRREPHRKRLLFFVPEEVEALARTLAAGLHRADPDGGRAARREDRQDAEIVRLAAYAGLRQGELLALRWRDIEFAGQVLTISRAVSLGTETTTKSGRVRRVPLPDQAAAALERVSRRVEFTAPDELVFCSALGRHLNGSALRRRFKCARDAVGLRPLRFHDLRHTYGSILAAAGVDLVTIQAAMGHSALATTTRYLHARPANEQAARFTRAFEPTTSEPLHA